MPESESSKSVSSAEREEALPAAADVREPAPSRQRESRFDSLDKLKDAVRAKCREHVRERASGAASVLQRVQGTEHFDVEGFEAHLRNAYEKCVGVDDSFELMTELDGVLTRVMAHLAASHEGDDDHFTSLLRHALSSQCRGATGDFDMSFGERWKHLQRLGPDGLPLALKQRRRERWPLGSSQRARLVAAYAVAPVGFWGEGVPSVRDLTCVTLLAGCFPGGTRQQQKEGHGRTLPTVLKVIGDEDAAVQATLRHAPLAPRNESESLSDVERYVRWVHGGMRWPVKNEPPTS